MIEEREQGIREIHHQIGEVNEIFKDLAVLVHDQGYMIGMLYCACCLIQYIVMGIYPPVIWKWWECEIIYGEICWCR